MVVVVILGVLAAIAIPAFIKFIRRANSAEAEEKPSRLLRSSAAYLTQEQSDRGATAAALPPRFPVSAPLTPGGEQDFCAPADANWIAPTCMALNFSVADPHDFVYQYDSSGTATSSEFTARAHADLDGDTTCSTYERAGFVTGSRGVWRALPDE